MALVLTPKDFDSDDPIWEQMCLELQELLQSDPEIVVSVPHPDDLPTDAKGEPITIGIFLLTLAAAPAAYRAVQGVNTWLHSLGDRNLNVTVNSGDEEFTTDVRGFSATLVESIVKAAKRRQEKR
jgi:hypothetical protein